MIPINATIDQKRHQKSMQRLYKAIGATSIGVLALAAVVETTAQPASLRNQSDYSICWNALGPGRIAWNQNPNSLNEVAEAQRRGLTVDACRRLLGLPSMSSPSIELPARRVFGALIALVVAAVVLAFPIISIIALLMTRSTRGGVRLLQERFQQLQARVATLETHPIASAVKEIREPTSAPRPAACAKPLEYEPSPIESRLPDTAVTQPSTPSHPMATKAAPAPPTSEDTLEKRLGTKWAVWIGGLRWRSTGRVFYPIVAATFAVSLSMLYISLEVRTLYHGPIVTGGTSDAEQYTYSAVWLTFGVLLLVGGFLLRSRPARLTSAAVVTLTIAKVFLIDMAGLTGIYRALSFIGLGVVLIGIGWFYQHILFGPSAIREGPTAADSVQTINGF